MYWGKRLASIFDSRHALEAHNPPELDILNTLTQGRLRGSKAPARIEEDTPMQSALPIQLEAAQDLRQLPRTIAGKAALAISASAFVALCAHVSVPLYFTPVPITLQTFAVLLIGLAFGPALGAATLLLYLAEGAAGLPVFSPQGGSGGIAQLHGLTAGYLFSYPLAAAAAGSVVRAVRIYRPQFHAAVLAAFAADLIVLATGASWLALVLRLSPIATWNLAIAPFLLGEVLKISAAAAAYTALLRWRRA